MEQGEENIFPRVERRAFSVGTLHDDSDERAYWLQQTPQQRLMHVERLRRINYGAAALARLQRVLEIASREPQHERIDP
jgi:hypothetical protein